MLASFYATNFNRKFEDAHFLQKMTSLDFHSFETFFLEKNDCMDGNEWDVNTGISSFYKIEVNW